MFTSLISSEVHISFKTFFKISEKKTLPMGYQEMRWNSLAVQWLGLWAFTAEGSGSMPGQGAKIPQAMRCSQKKKEIK